MAMKSVFDLLIDRVQDYGKYKGVLRIDKDSCDNYISVSDIKKIIRDVEEEYNDGWIACSERLPQEGEPETALCEIVNITLKNGTVTVGWCNRYLEKWFVLDEHCDYPISCKYEDVLAWQPIPAPYQKGE